MKKMLLKSKLHRINVTQVELDYEGSCAVDKSFLDAANMQEYEKVEVYNVTNGERFSTYLILAEEGSKTLSVNGAAAHKGKPGDPLVIMTFINLNPEEAAVWEPRLIIVSNNNNSFELISSPTS